METRLKRYMEYYRKVAAGEEAIEGDPEAFRREMLVQIGFFQHERLIHLIVTVLFALLAVISILVNVMVQEMAVQEMAVLALCLMFFVLLIPYIRHYYILENGVQKLYEYYDVIEKAAEGAETK